MNERIQEFTSPDELLSAMRHNALAAEKRPHIALDYARNASNMTRDIEMLAERTGQTPEKYAEGLVLQRLQGEVLAGYMADAPTPVAFGMGTKALGIWLDNAMDIPRDSAHAGLINNRALAVALLSGGSRLLDHTHGQAEEVVEALVPFFGSDSTKQSHKRLANALQQVAADYTSAVGLRKLGNPAYPRAAMSILAEATAAGHAPADFWYRYGVRSAQGGLQFHVVEGMYDLLFLRGYDIRSRHTTTTQLWEHIPNFCLEIVGSLEKDPTRHQGNVLLLKRHLEGQRSQGAKRLPTVAIVELANALTAKINATADGFGADYDDTDTSGPRPMLSESGIQDLPEAMLRLLYITRRADQGTEVLEWQRYQDYIFSGSVEGLLGALGAPSKAKKVGGIALQQTAATQNAHDAARRAVPRPNFFDWKRNKPGHGILS